MNPVKRIELINFQSHQKTVIEPAGPGSLTVVTGPSDTGKSSVIRALKWLLYNEPQGTDFVRTGCSMVGVTVIFANGISVSRERTKTVNRYKIIRSSTQEPEVFEGFGGSVPVEVQEITGVRTVKIADQDLMLNLSEQLDGPFLGNKSISAPGRARILGKLAGTEEIDIAGMETGKDLYRRGQDEKRLDREIERLSAQLKEFAWLPELEKRIKKIESMVSELKNARDRILQLKNLELRLTEIKHSILQSQKIVSRWSVLAEAEKNVYLIELKAERRKRLSGNRDLLSTVLRDSDLIRNKLRGLAGLNQAEICMEKTEQKIERSIQFTKLRYGLDLVVADMDKCKQKLKSAGIINIDRVTEIVNKLAGFYARRDSLYAKKLLWTQIIESEKPKLFQKIVFYDARIPELEQQYFDELMETGICPVCGNNQFDIQRLREVV